MRDVMTKTMKPGSQGIPKSTPRQHIGDQLT